MLFIYAGSGAGAVVVIILGVLVYVKRRSSLSGLRAAKMNTDIYSSREEIIPKARSNQSLQSSDPMALQKYFSGDLEQPELGFSRKAKETSKLKNHDDFDTLVRIQKRYEQMNSTTMITAMNPTSMGTRSVVQGRPPVQRKK